MPRWVMLATGIPWGVLGVIHPYLGMAGLSLQLVGLINLAIYKRRNRNESRKDID